MLSSAMGSLLGSHINCAELKYTKERICTQQTKKWDGGRQFLKLASDPPLYSLLSLRAVKFNIY